MFIVVDKIITQYEKDSKGNTVKNPMDQKPVAVGLKVVKETIRVDEIKAVRAWNKTSFQDKYIKTDIVSVYMLDIDRNKDASSKKRAAEIHIAESLESFNKRIGAL